MDTLKLKLQREERKLEENEDEFNQRKMEEMGTHAENIFSLFGKRRRTLTTSLTKRRLTEQSKSDVKESEALIADMQKQLAAIDEELQREVAEISERWSRAANDIAEIPIAPLKKDVLLDFFGVAWMPYHLVKIGEEIEELPGYAPAS